MNKKQMRSSRLRMEARKAYRSHLKNRSGGVVENPLAVTMTEILSGFKSTHMNRRTGG